MAGHSKFKNIMHRKGAQDKKRSAMFSKLSREITVAAKMGLPDPDMNARLRAAVLAAKAQSMPKVNIQRSIDKATGSDAETYEEIRYEGFGPGGVALGQFKNRPGVYSGRGMAVAGLVLGIVALVVFVVYLVAVIASDDGLR